MPAFGLKITASEMIPRGMQMLWNDGKPVVYVPVGAPIEDAECDHIQMNPFDYDRLAAAIPPQS